MDCGESTLRRKTSFNRTAHEFFVNGEMKDAMNRKASSLSSVNPAFGYTSPPTLHNNRKPHQSGGCGRESRCPRADSG